MSGPFWSLYRNLKLDDQCSLFLVCGAMIPQVYIWQRSIILNSNKMDDSERGRGWRGSMAHLSLLRAIVDHTHVVCPSVCTCTWWGCGWVGEWMMIGQEERGVDASMWFLLNTKMSRIKHKPLEINLYNACLINSSTNVLNQCTQPMYSTHTILHHLLAHFEHNHFWLCFLKTSPNTVKILIFISPSFRGITPWTCFMHTAWYHSLHLWQHTISSKWEVTSTSWYRQIQNNSTSTCLMILFLRLALTSSVEVW